MNTTVSDEQIKAALDKAEKVAVESGAHASYRACREAFSELRALLALKPEQLPVVETGLRHRLRAHLSNRCHYSHVEFCTKLEEIIAECKPELAGRALRDGEVMNAYLQFDRMADKSWSNVDYLVNFGSFISGLTAKVWPEQVAAQGEPKTFLKERAQLEQEWCELRKLKAAYTRPAPVAPAVQDNDVAWKLAEKVRTELDRQSCPGYYMDLAMESIVKHWPNPAPVAQTRDDLADLIDGMSVSVDVSTGPHDTENRYMGTVTEVMEDPHSKHGVTLLVQDAAPNFDLPLSGVSKAAPVAQVPEGFHEALQKVSDEWGLEMGESTKAAFCDLIRFWKPADTDHIMIPLDELIERDSYGVHGSDFYRCKLCGGESGAGVLNNGIQHDTNCYLASPKPQEPQEPMQASGVQVVEQAVMAERERCQRVCQIMSMEFCANSNERDVLQRVATRLDMPEHEPAPRGQS